MTTLDVSETANETEQAWQKLSPAAILFFIVGSIAGFVKSIFEAIAWGAAAYTFVSDRFLSLPFLIPIVLLLFVVRPIARYLTFRFKVTDSAFLVKSGILSRKRLTLSFERIQSTNVSEPFYYRPFGLVNLSLESAGSSDEEVVLPGITAQQARAVKRQILGASNDTAVSPHTHTSSQTYAERLIKSTIEDDASSRLITHRPVPELIRYGISNNRALAILGLLSAGFWQLDDTIFEVMFERVMDSALAFVPSGALYTGLLVVTLVGMGSLLFALISSLGAIIQHYNYTLRAGPERLTRSEGLFEKKETHISRTKIQLVRFSQPLLAVLLARWHGSVRQVGHAKKDGGKRDTTLVVPSLTEDLMDDVCSDIFGEKGLTKVPFLGIHRHYLWKTVIGDFGIPAAIATASLTINLGPIGLLCLFVPVLAIPFVELRRRRYGYQMTDTHMVLRSGFVGSSKAIFALHKVQSVSIIRSPGHRRAKLASVRFNLAGSHITLPYIPFEVAEDIRDACLHAAETHQSSWM